MPDEQTNPTAPAGELTQAAPASQPGTTGSQSPAGAPAATTDNSDLRNENSKLGRKVARLEGNINTLSEQIAQMTTLLAQNQARPANPDSQAPEIVATAEDVERITERREARKAEEIRVAQAKYQQGYLNTVARMGENEELHEEIVDLLTKPGPFNLKHSGNPEMDANLNYTKAKSFILEQRLANPGETVATASSRMGVTGRSATSGAPKIKLDPLAARFARDAQMTDEEIARVLGH